MGDVIAVSMMVVLLAVSMMYVTGCERLKGGTR